MFDEAARAEHLLKIIKVPLVSRVTVVGWAGQGREECQTELTP